MCTLFGLVIMKKKYSWLNPAYSWNKQLAHTPFPKRITTPSTTLRFIGFVAKISVLNPKLPANDQRTEETKESVIFFILSPLLDRLKNPLLDRLKKKELCSFVSLYLFLLILFLSIYLFCIFLFFLLIYLFQNRVKNSI